jgi:hypothetical protein
LTCAASVSFYAHRPRLSSYSLNVFFLGLGSTLIE